MDSTAAAKNLNMEEICGRYRRLYAGAIYDVLEGLGFPNQALSHKIKALAPGMKLAGPAADRSATEGKMKRLLIAAAGAITLLCGILYGQGVLEPHPYMKHGIIEHHTGVATVKVDFGRPLEQAITAVREEYGWVVDYEDPPYTGKDVMDVTNPKYRAAHPNAPIWLGPTGGAFLSTYPETPNMWSSPEAEQEVLEKIVSDYNQSGNPGNFVLRRLQNGAYDVVGTSTHSSSGADVPVTPILDTPVSVPSVSRTMGATLDAILGALPVKAACNCPYPLDESGPMTVGGTHIPARALIMRAIPTGGNWVWLLLYGPQEHQYVLSPEIAMRTVYDAFGQKRLIPIAPAPAPSGLQ